MTMDVEPAGLNDFFQYFAQSLAEGIAIVNARGQLAFANRALEQLLGCEPGGLNDRPWKDLFADGKASPSPALAVSLPGAGARRYRAELRHTKGTSVPVLVTTYVLSTDDQDHTELSTFTALSPPHQPKAHIDQLEKLASMGRFVSSIVHELNNSLTILVLQSQYLSRNSPSSPQFAEHLSLLQDQAKQMRQIITNLRTSVDPRQPQLESADVNAILRQTLDLQAENLQGNGIKVVVELDSSLPVTRVDPFQLQQVFVNLINNAHQAMVAADLHGELRISTHSVPAQQEAPARIQIRFSDTGPGIPPELLGRIFEPFFTTKRPGEGMGLGLSICDQIVRAHGGHILAKNNTERGATFLIELPVLGPGGLSAPPPPDRRFLNEDEGRPGATSLEQMLRQAGLSATASTRARGANAP